MLYWNINIREHHGLSPQIVQKVNELFAIVKKAHAKYSSFLFEL